MTSVHRGSPGGIYFVQSTEVPQLTGHHMFGLAFVPAFNISCPISFLRHINKLHQLDQITCHLFKILSACSQGSIPQESANEESVGSEWTVDDLNYLPSVYLFGKHCWHSKNHCWHSGLTQLGMYYLVIFSLSVIYYGIAIVKNTAPES
ncbi:hypothetical protein ACN38_g9712, partial [Penicillium nordicum]